MYYLGVDLGGTNIAAGIVTENGKIVYKESIPTGRGRGFELILADLAALCKAILQKQKLALSDIRSIGIGTPGAVDQKRGVILYASNINFSNTDVGQILRQYFDVPLFLENDANCAALAESIGGAAKGYRHSITITLGTGIGGGIITDGRIMTGAFFGGGEVGHHVVSVGGELCACGRRGCWEAYASATALIRDAKIAAVRNPHSYIMQLVRGDMQKINGRTVFDAASHGDPEAKSLVDNYLRYVAEGIANLINIFQPEIIVIGGGICAQGEALLEPVRKMTKSLIYGGENEMKTILAAAELGNDAGIIGAAMLGRKTD